MIMKYEQIMKQNNDIRKAFGARLKQLRKQKGWSQKELANRLNMRFPQLNKYEGGLHVPPIEKIIELSEIFDITLDFLITGNRSDERPLHNIRLLEQFRELEDFDAEDQETVMKLIEAVIAKRKMEGILKMTGRNISG